MSSWWLLGKPHFVYSNSVGRLKLGQEFGLVIDGDEFCVRLGEKMFATASSPRPQIVEKSEKSDNARLARDCHIRATMSANEQRHPYLALHIHAIIRFSRQNRLI